MKSNNAYYLLYADKLIIWLNYSWNIFLHVNEFILLLLCSVWKFILFIFQLSIIILELCITISPNWKERLLYKRIDWNWEKLHWSLEYDH